MKHAANTMLQRALGLVLALCLLVPAAASAATHQLLLSRSPDRSSPVALDGQSLSGDVYVFTDPSSGTKQVSFYIDGGLAKTEYAAPYDLAGTASDGSAYPFHSSSLSEGSHTLTARISLIGGGTETLNATVSVANQAPALQFSTASVSLSAAQGGSPASTSVSLSASDGAGPGYSLSSSAAWLSGSPASGTAPQGLTVSADPAGLAAGTYTATLTASASGYTDASLQVSFTVSSSGGYALLLSHSPDRSSPVALDGQSLSGEVYVFTSPSSGVRQVRFYIDGSLAKTENIAPYDLGGTNPDDSAAPFDTTVLADGGHSLSAQIDLSGGGTETVNATVSVANQAPALQFSTASVSLSAAQGGSPASTSVSLSASDGAGPGYSLSSSAAWLSGSPASGTAPQGLTVSADPAGLAAGTYTATLTASASGYTDASLQVSFTVSSSGGYALLLSHSPDRSSPVALDGQSLSGEVYVFTSPSSGVRQVRFYIDGSLAKTENIAPYDLGGTNPDDSAAPFDTTVLADGGHSLSAQIDLSGGGTETVNAAVSVDNGGTLPADDFSDGNANGWTVVDDSGGSSNWHVVSGAYREDDPVGTIGEALDGSYQLGTYSYLDSARAFALSDYRFTVDLTPQSQEGLTAGVMFRYRDNDNYYRLTINSREGFTRLEKKAGGQFSTLAVDGRGYRRGQRIALGVVLRGAQILIYRDGEPLFAVHDAAIAAGSVALFTRDLASFDNVLLTQPGTDPELIVGAPLAYSVTSADRVQISARAANVPAGEQVELTLDGSPCGSVQNPSPGLYTSTCTGLAATDYAAAGRITGTSAQDSNPRVGAQGDFRIAVGDSITNGKYDNYAADDSSADGRQVAFQGFEAPLNDLLAATLVRPEIVFNEGVPGDESADTLLFRIDSILERYPAAQEVLLLLGTNDAGARVPPGLGCTGSGCDGTFKGNMQGIVDRIAAAGKRTVVALIPPAFGSSSLFSDPATATRNTQYVAKYNDVIRNELNGISIGPDFYGYFLGDGENRFSLFADRLHPNGLGYAVMAQLWRNALTGATALPFVLANLAHSTSAPYLKQNLLEVGDTYYVDSTATLSSIPAELRDGIWVMTANAERDNTASDYLDFSIDRPATVYVGYDAAAPALPDWLVGFTDTGLQIATTDTTTPTLRVYSASYAAGTVRLGGNRAAGASGNGSHYVVVVVPN